MLKPLRSNPLLDQTLRAGRRPSLGVTLVLLIALLAGAMVGRGRLIDHLPAEARAVLLLLLWLLPLVTMSIAAISTVRRVSNESFQLVRQSPLTDRQITWGLGLSTLYTLRLVLVLAFGLLPALIDDTPLGGVSTALCLAGLHLAASMLGTVLVLRWGRQRLGVMLAVICCTLMVALLPTLNTFLTPIMAPGCPSTSLHPIHLRLSFLLLRWGPRGLLPTIIVAALSLLLGWTAGLLPWRGREEGWYPRLEALGLVLAVGLLLGLWMLDASHAEDREHQALVALYQATGGENWRFSLGWLSDQPACSWFGVSCICGRVAGLSLFDNNLQGTVPPEIGQLIALQDLALYNNSLTELPPEFGQLTGLQVLLLRGNQLTTLPPEFGQLTDLRSLDLSENQLTELPPEICQLPNLQVIEPPELCNH